MYRMTSTPCCFLTLTAEVATAGSRLAVLRRPTASTFAPMVSPVTTGPTMPAWGNRTAERALEPLPQRQFQHPPDTQTQAALNRPSCCGNRPIPPCTASARSCWKRCRGIRDAPGSKHRPRTHEKARADRGMGSIPDPLAQAHGYSRPLSPSESARTAVRPDRSRRAATVPPRYRNTGAGAGSRADRFLGFGATWAWLAAPQAIRLPRASRG